MNIPHLDPVTLASLVGAGALALTRLLTTAKPVWDRLPPSLQGLLPALVLVLPQIAAAALGVHTSLDLVNLLVLSTALILPGVHSHTVALVKPSGPSSGAMVGLVFALMVSSVGCSRLAAVNWPKQLGTCAAPLDPGLIKSVGAVLAGTGDVESDLASIVQSGAPADAVECAVAQLVGDIGLRPAEARESRQAERGRAFLAKVHQ